MDLESRKKLSELIKKATSTGTLELSTEHIQQFKLILKQSNSNVKSAFDLLFDRLKIKHSQIRISTLNIINEIFMRSKYFRELLCGVLSIFFEYTLGVNSNTELPPPVNSAIHLKSKTLEYIEKWNDSFGAHYTLLRNGYYYLKNSLMLNFPEIRNQILIRTREENERKEKTQKLLRLKYDKLKFEFLDISNSIQSLIDSMENLFKEMIPDPSSNFEDLFDNDDEEGDENLFGSDDEEYKQTVIQKRTKRQEERKKKENQEKGEEQEDEEEQEETNHSNIIRDGGFGSLSYAIEVSINPDETKENLDEIKVKQLGNMVTELEKYQNLTVNDWYTTLIKIEINTQSDPEYSDYLKKVIQLQQNINNIKLKSKDIDILPFQNVDDDENNEEAIDEFEGIEMEEYTSEQARSDAIERKKKTTTTTTTTTSEEKKIYKPYYRRDIKPVHVDQLPEGESVEDLLKRAPIVPLDPLLLFWGQKEIVLDTGINREHRFLGDSNEATISIENFNKLNQVSYTIDEETISSIPCNYPLKSGGLCQRRDLKVCPFHGTIVPRDDITGDILDDDDYNDNDNDNGGNIDNEDNNNNNEQQEENGTPKKRKVAVMIGSPIYKPPTKENIETPKKRNTSNLVDISEKANETVKTKIDKILSKKK